MKDSHKDRVVMTPNPLLLCDFIRLYVMNFEVNELMMLCNTDYQHVACQSDHTGFPYNSGMHYSH